MHCVGRCSTKAPHRTRPNFDLLQRCETRRLQLSWKPSSRGLSSVKREHISSTWVERGGKHPLRTSTDRRTTISPSGLRDPHRGKRSPSSSTTILPLLRKFSNLRCFHQHQFLYQLHSLLFPSIAFFVLGSQQSLRRISTRLFQIQNHKRCSVTC